uniref:Uncharacterized protein n=1 Tax=Candidozyma auris TaxID=498019 RepID=A0A0L0NWQ8_CANAR
MKDDTSFFFFYFLLLLVCLRVIYRHGAFPMPFLHFVLAVGEGEQRRIDGLKGESKSGLVRQSVTWVARVPPEPGKKV